MSRPGAYIFDIDGVLADTAPIAHLLPVDFTGDYTAWHHAASSAPPLTDGVARWMRHRDEDVWLDGVIFTARSEAYRHQTLLWLGRMNVYCERLFMRPLGDLRPDVAVKRDMLSRLRLTHDVRAAYDDNWAIVQLYELAGIPRVVFVTESRAVS